MKNPQIAFRIRDREQYIWFIENINSNGRNRVDWYDGDKLESFDAFDVFGENLAVYAHHEFIEAYNITYAMMEMKNLQIVEVKDIMSNPEGLTKDLYNSIMREAVHKQEMRQSIVQIPGFVHEYIQDARRYGYESFSEIVNELYGHLLKNNSSDDKPKTSEEVVYIGTSSRVSSWASDDGNLKKLSIAWTYGNYEVIYRKRFENFTEV